MTMTARGFGNVLLDAGHVIVGPSGDLEFSSGKLQLEEYYAGDTHIVDDLCAALGTPNG
jgi:hypothetical protein